MNPLVGRPMLLSPEMYRVVCAIAAREMTGERIDALAARAGTPLKNSYQVSVRDDVAVLPVHGVLCRHANLFTDVSGATSYDFLARDFQRALEDAAMRGILLDIDSPGGDANGVGEFAGMILAARGRKPIVAYVGGVALSAAYWIAAACETVVAHETAFLGCLGAVCSYLDVSQAEEQAGRRTIEVVSTQTPLKRARPTTDAGLAIWQERVDALAERFLSGVAACRGVSLAQVEENFGRGDQLIAGAALRAGMCDAIGSFESLLGELAGKATTGPRLLAATVSPRENTMMKCAGCSSEIPEGDPIYCEDCGGGRAAAKAVGLAENATRAELLMRLDSLAGFERTVLLAVGTGVSLDAAAGKIAAALADQVELVKLRSAVEATAATARAKELRAVLKAGIDSKRLNLGQVQRVVPLLLDDKAAATAALAALEKQEAPAMIDALAVLPVSAAALERVTAFASSCGVAVPAAITAPEPPPEETTGEGPQLDAATNARMDAVAAEARAVLDRSKK